jgi:formate dehydrogenase major subunit
MKLSRRGLFKLAAATAGGSALVSGLGFDLRKAHAASRKLKISQAREYHTICPYCAVGCGTIAYVHGSGGLNTIKSIVHIEGDGDNPINGGTLCPKGASQMQLALSPRVQRKPLYRAAKAKEWKEISWDEAMDWFARKFKESRDHTFVEKDGKGQIVNRCEGIGWVGSATVNNEDAYLIVKTMRAMGLVYIDHQARI